MASKLTQALTSSELLIFAHRGLSARYPENSLPAFQAALSVGCTGIECDVRLSANHIPIVFHDETLNRMTGVHGKIYEKTFEELRQVTLFGTDSGIPSLQELLQITGAKTLLNFELKAEKSKERNRVLVEKVVSLVYQYQLEESVIISSFDLSLLRYLPEEIHKSVLVSSTWFGTRYPRQQIEAIRPVAIHCSIRQAKEKLLRKANQDGLPVLVYTVNEKTVADRLSAMGVKGFFTDNPALFIRNEEN